MDLALDILQEYDINGAHTEKITPAAILKMRKMEPKQASFWLENEFPQINAIRIPSQKHHTASLLVYGTVVTPQDQRSYSFVALIDSGCTITAIDRGFVKQHKIPTKLLDEPLQSYLGDGTAARMGLITEYVELQMRIGQHHEIIRLVVMDLAKMDIFLGYDWLDKHNPNVDWREHTISFTQCLSSCGKEHTLQAVDFQTAVWEEPEWFRAFATKSTLLAQEANAQKKEKTFEEMVPKTYHEFKDVFEPTLFDELPERKPWDHAINLKPDAPDSLRCKLYPLSIAERQKLDEFINENMRTGRIRPLKSPYASPFFFVAKKDAAELRPVQDYQKLNDITIDDFH